MKRKILAVLMILVLASPLSFVWANSIVIATAKPSRNVTIKVNQNVLKINEAPAYIDTELGLTYVPLRFVSEALGAKVEWDQEAYEAIATLGKRVIEVGIEQATMQITQNGTTTGAKLEGQARLDIFPNALGEMEGRIMVPLRAISEGLGANVEWKNEERTVEITFDKPVETVKEFWETWTPDPQNSEYAQAFFTLMKYDRSSDTLTFTIPEFKDGTVRVILNENIDGDAHRVVAKTGESYTYTKGSWYNISIRAVKNSTGNIETYSIYPDTASVMGFSGTLPAELKPIVIDSSDRTENSNQNAPKRIVTLDAILEGLYNK